VNDRNENVTYPVRFARHMKCTALELGEVLEKYEHKGSHVLGSFLRRALDRGGSEVQI
jgi:hypothetical protein